MSEKKYKQMTIGKGMKVAPPIEAVDQWTVSFVDTNDDPKRFSAWSEGIASFETRPQAERYLRQMLFNWMDGNMMLDPDETEMEDHIRQRFMKNEMSTLEMETLVKKHAEPEFGVTGFTWKIEATKFYPTGHTFCSSNESFVKDAKPMDTKE